MSKAFHTVRALAWGVVAVGLAGCDHTHLSPHYGAANRAAYRAQVIDPNAGAGVRPDQPLDPEESAIVATTYFRSLQPEDVREKEPPKSTVLVVPPPQPGALPAPGPGAQP